MKSSEDKVSANSSAGGSCPGASTDSKNVNAKIRIAVFGQHEVGKSALTVRYLTKRYIGEYKSSTDLLYQQTVKIGPHTIDVEIVDISTSSSGPIASRRKSFPVEEIQRADGFIIVYSITDRNSFTFAQEALETISNFHGQSGISNCPNGTSTSNPNSSPASSPQPKASCPILLLANKLDLEHLRVVEKTEGVNMSLKYNSAFHELSVAENSPEVYSSIQNLIGSFVQKETSRRKFSVSKMLGNLRIGRTSPSHVVTSQASICDTDILSSEANETENIPAASTLTEQKPLAPVTRSRLNSGGFANLKSKFVELQSMKRRNNSPPICSL